MKLAQLREIASKRNGPGDSDFDSVMSFHIDELLDLVEAADVMAFHFSTDSMPHNKTIAFTRYKEAREKLDSVKYPRY